LSGQNGGMRRGRCCETESGGQGEETGVPGTNGRRKGPEKQKKMHRKRLVETNLTKQAERKRSQKKGGKSPSAHDNKQNISEKPQKDKPGVSAGCLDKIKRQDKKPTTGRKKTAQGGGPGKGGGCKGQPGDAKGSFSKREWILGKGGGEPKMGGGKKEVGSNLC